MSDSDPEVDVLVVGAGGCGLAAAIAAHDAGASVAVVEKRETPGGNTAVSTGSVPGAGTRFQRAAGIEDSPELFRSDLMALSGPHDAGALVRRLADCSAELVEWLADKAGVTLDIITDYKHVGHSVPRLHAPASRKGADLMAELLRALERRDIPLALSSPVVSLETGGEGAVVGASIGGGRSGASRIAAARTILAVNGFGNDRELVRRHCPEIAGASYVGALGSEGEAVRWGEKLGSAFGNMASYQGYASIIHPHGELLSWTTIEKGGIFVNEKGERFGDEVVGYSGFAAPVHRQEGPVFAIFDRKIRDVAAREPWFKEILDYGGARKAETLGELAEAAGLPADALEATVAAYNKAAAGGEADPHGRLDFAMAPLEAPFWYTQVQAALLSTQGGLAIDTDGRVLREDGRPVPNLFAGGGAVAGISGRSGGVGYASGSGLLHAIGLGWIAGRAAAAELPGAD